MADKTKAARSLADVIVALRAAVAAAYKLAPAVVVLIVIVAAGVIATALLSSKLMMGVTIVIVWAVATLVYAKTANFGEAALALVAGLLTAFSVSWTPLRFVGFSVAWVGFAAVALLISSVRLAATVERLYRDAATAVAEDVSSIPEVERHLREIGEKLTLGQVGPVQRAEILRLLALRKLPIDLMRPILQTTETIAVVTRLEPLRLARFFADLYRALGAIPSEFVAMVDAVDRLARRSAVPPEEFIGGFEQTRHLLLSREVRPQDYFHLLQTGLEAGIPGDCLTTWIQEHAQRQGV